MKPRFLSVAGVPELTVSAVELEPALVRVVDMERIVANSSIVEISEGDLEVVKPVLSVLPA